MLIQAIMAKTVKMALMSTFEWPNMATSIVIIGAYSKSKKNVYDP